MDGLPIACVVYMVFAFVSTDDPRLHMDMV